ncbi:helix-turn-helix domain-containing protein [Cohnella cellulosilytica]|uniref:Helix-turn-helix domain-containing protein n=1 Tax=Cohnella cellulosilytica TaxID=986710 RepID=A0ABW2FHJ5_9BACL
MKGPTFSPMFRKFAISYLIVLLLPNIAGYLSYRASADVAVANSVENSRLLLNQSKEILETRLNEVKSFTKQLAINQDLTRLMSETLPEGEHNVYGLWKMSRDISNFSKTNEYLQSFYIYLNNSDVVLAPDAVFFRPEHFYANNRYADMSLQEWREGMLNRIHENEILPLSPYVRSNNPSSVITVVQSLPLNSLYRPKATVVVTINERKVGSLLDSMSERYGGWGFITDGDGNTMLASGIDQADIEQLARVPSGLEEDWRRFENGMLLISIRSDATGWRYTAGIPEGVVKEKANQIQRETWTFNAVALLAGLLIVVLFSYRNSAPIARLLGMFKEHPGTDGSAIRNEYVFLAGSISRLMSSNKELEEELDKQLPLLRDSFVKRLLTGEFLSPGEIAAVSSRLGMKPLPERGCVGLVRMIGYDSESSEEMIHEYNLARLVLKAKLLETMPRLLITDWGSDKIAVLYPFGETESGEAEEEDGFARRLEQASGNALRNYPMTLALATGDSYRTLRDVSRSFDEAQQALEHSAYAGENRLTRYREIVRETEMFYYPIDTEQRLLKTLKAGDAEESLRVLDRVLTMNLAERELSYEMRQQLISELKGTLLKLLDQQPFYDEEFAAAVGSRIAQLQPADKTEKLRSALEWIVNELCRDVSKKKVDRYHETIEAVKQFIEREYANADLSLYRIVEAVNRPEKFVTQLFKEYAGESPIDYLERVRIGRAAELLLENELTIDEIAVQVGYNSGHSFRRAFKRVKGTAPSAYRQSSL